MKSITTNELREMYQQFFEGKKHVRIKSAPLVPEHDPSVLFTTAGMHPLVPYLKGQPHPQGKRLTNVQKCLRTTDIDDVGDTTHATVFEMLGNWSLGDYFKKEAIEWSWEFLTSKHWLGLDPDYLAISVFSGDPTLPRRSRTTGLRGASAPRDEESAKYWQSVGVPKERIAYLGKQENWWPAGGEQPGPQGPDTEMFFYTGEDTPPKQFDPNDDRWVEIWNDVFMQYNLKPDGSYEPLPQQNVDTGMGLERTVMVLNGHPSIYHIDSIQDLMTLIEQSAGRRNIRHERILADHIKAATFLLGDEHPVKPSNTDQGYVLRRIIRRAVRSARELQLDTRSVMDEGLQIMVRQYEHQYPPLRKYVENAREELQTEIEKFEFALQRGLKEFTRAIEGKQKGGVIRGCDAFKLYESYGFPIELTQELADELGLTIDMGGFEEASRTHQEQSREATKSKFAGGLADHSKKAICYHTATHLLHQALRDVLGDHVLQKGSNITRERLRFDFSYSQKMNEDEIKQVEDLVNEKIKADLPVVRAEMSLKEAKQKGALGLFEQKYSDTVSVYTIGQYSCEICGGPHVAHTGELGNFRITKEESVSTGIRRIKAVLE